MDQLLHIIRTLGIMRVAILAFSTLLLFGLFAMIIMKATAPPMSILYGGLNTKEASSIVEHLASRGIPYEVKGDGSVYVPQDMVAEARLNVAGEGLVGTSINGYELFDKNSSFGTTALQQNINAQRALEGEIARTIMSLSSVSTARVLLVMPKRRLFQKNPVQPTASVSVDIGSRVLSDDQVQSITHLVASAVPDLTPENVTVTDQRGKLLSSGENSQATAMTRHNRVRRQLEADYEQRVTRMIERAVGPNNVTVTVNAEMNFDRIEEKSEIFDPETQVVRSSQRTENVRNSSESSGGPAVGASANIPGQEAGGSASGSQDNQTINDETVNYEISKTIRSHVREGGEIERLTVSVLVRGRSSINEDGEEVYSPYNQADIQKFERLVQNAIGYDETRGDSVEIIDMAFTEVVVPEAEIPFLTKDDYRRIGEFAFLTIVILMIIFLIVRPIIKAAGKVQSPLEMSAPDIPQPHEIVNPETGEVEIVSREQIEESLIDIDQVEGKVKESSIKRVIDVIDQYPEETIQIIRGWMGASESS